MEKLHYERLQAMDRFLLERTEEDENGRVYVPDLASEYYMWAGANGEPQMGRNLVSKYMQELGHKKKQTSFGYAYWAGLRMRERKPCWDKREGVRALLEFLDERTEGARDGEVYVNDLMREYFRWCERNGRPAMIWREAVKCMEFMGYEQEPLVFGYHEGPKCWRGLRLKKEG